jgi:diacylglycerol kinase family enzyme
MKNYILYNPLAGHGDCNEKLSKLKGFLQGDVVECDVTKSYDNLWDNLLPDDKIVISGGDGTLNKFINEVNTDSIENDILYYGSGSGNDFLHDLGREPESEPFKINQYLKNLPTVTIKGKTYRFLNGIGFGIDGYCCEVGDKIKATSDKPVNYTAIAIKGLLYAFKPVKAKVTVDGQSYEFNKVWIAPTMNGRCYGGGMMPTPDQDRLGDGSVSCMVLYGSGKIKTLMMFPSIFKGEHIKYTEMISIFKGREVTVEFDRPCPLQIDGETVLDVTSYTVRSAK